MFYAQGSNTGMVKMFSSSTSKKLGCRILVTFPTTGMERISFLWFISMTWPLTLRKLWKSRLIKSIISTSWTGQERTLRRRSLKLSQSRWGLDRSNSSP